MDIHINKDIKQPNLNAFLTNIFPNRKCTLIYKGNHDWKNLEENEIQIEFSEDIESNHVFKFGIIVATTDSIPLTLIESIAALLSEHFKCSTICDASRILLCEHNFYYSLYFENKKVFLIDDIASEEISKVSKIVELSYRSPQLL